MIDVCTKYMVIIPIMSKNEANVASGFMEALNKIKGNPQILYADDEKVLNTDAIQQNLKRHKIWWACHQDIQRCTYKRIEAKKRN